MKKVLLVSLLAIAGIAHAQVPQPPENKIIFPNTKKLLADKKAADASAIVGNATITTTSYASIAHKLPNMDELLADCGTPGGFGVMYAPIDLGCQQAYFQVIAEFNKEVDFRNARGNNYAVRTK